MICRNTYAFAQVRQLVLTALFATTRKFRIPVMLAALWLCGSGSLLARTFTTRFGAGGPAKKDGMIFKITPSGTFTTLHSGGEYVGTLVQGTDGNFYGTTSGTIFKITPTGTLTTLHNGVDANALVQASDGNFYGTTLSWGQNYLPLLRRQLWHDFQPVGWSGPRSLNADCLRLAAAEAVGIRSSDSKDPG
jgi:hypothetical protein